MEKKFVVPRPPSRSLSVSVVAEGKDAQRGCSQQASMNGLPSLDVFPCMKGWINRPPNWIHGGKKKQLQFAGFFMDSR